MFSFNDEVDIKMQKTHIRGCQLLLYIRQKGHFHKLLVKHFKLHVQVEQNKGSVIDSSTMNTPRTDARVECEEYHLSISYKLPSCREGQRDSK